jgi:hypothetical protein
MVDAMSLQRHADGGGAHCQGQAAGPVQHGVTGVQLVLGSHPAGSRIKLR